MTPQADHHQARWIAALQVLLGVSLIGFLAWQAFQNEAFRDLADKEIRTGHIAVAAVLAVGNLLLCFVRWRLVALAAGLPMSLAESFRIGAAGYAANFVALGSIGGDVLKAALLARDRPGRRALAVTTVVVDRATGLLALLLLATVAIFASGVLADASPLAIRVTAQGTLAITAVGIVCFTIATSPGRPLLRLAAKLRDTPLLGRSLANLALLLDSYRHGRRCLLAALGIGLAADAALVGSFYLVAKALPLQSPGLFAHYWIVPLGLIAGALPVSPNGLGTVETAIDLFYQAVGSGAPASHGALVTFAHRLLLMALGAVAIVYYFASKDRWGAEATNTNNSSPASEVGSGTAVAASAAPNASRQTV